MSTKSLVWCAVSAIALTAVAGIFSTSAVGAAPGGAPTTNPADAPGMGGAPMGGRGARGGGRGGPQAPANLSGAMGDMGRMLTAIKGEAADDTKTEQTLKDLAQFERDVAIAKMQTPPTNKLDDATKAKAPDDFRAAMTTLQRTLLDLEDAVVAKKADDIKKCIAKLGDTEKAGHTEFKVGQ